MCGDGSLDAGVVTRRGARCAVSTRAAKFPLFYPFLLRFGLISVSGVKAAPGACAGTVCRSQPLPRRTKKHLPRASS